MSVKEKMQWPKRAQTVDYRGGILTLDGQKRFELPKLSIEIMKQLAEYKLVGFYVKGYPMTDELLAPFTGHKYMVNFGVEDATLTDHCFSIFCTMPKLRYLLLDGNTKINGSGLSVLKDCKIDLLALNCTALNDEGLLQAANIAKLTHIQIDHTAITYDGLLAITVNNRIEPVSRVQFTKEQMETFSRIQREKGKKSEVLDQEAAHECRKILSDFFAQMSEWEKYVSVAGFEDAQVMPRLLLIWDKYVSEKPRCGFRPLGLSYSPEGTYSSVTFMDAEQVTRNKLYIYTKEEDTDFEYRFWMKRTQDGWKIDGVQMRLDGWQRIGL